MYEFFSEKELSCRCGNCGLGQDDMDEAFMRKIVQMRIELDFAMPVSSAIRCPDHNNNVSSTGRDGPHTTGKALDIVCFGDKAHRILGWAAPVFQGVGVSQKGNRGRRFIHLDDLQSGEVRSPRPWVWSY